MNQKHSLTLFYFDECPFCQKVLSYMEEHNIVISMKNIKKVPAFQAELIEKGGKKQVPCLLINGRALYESSDIISWMEEHLTA